MAKALTGMVINVYRITISTRYFWAHDTQLCSVFLAESSPERVVYGIDLSDLVVAANLDRIKQLDSKVQERIKFLCIDFFNSQDHLQDASFDFLFDYTFLCAIHPDYRPDWVKTLSRLLKKGAMLATLMYPLNETRPLDDGPPFPLSPELYHELLDETFDLVSLEDVALDRSLPRRAGKEKMGIWRRK